MIHTLFLASLFFGVLGRHRPILVIAATILLKTLVHGVIVAQPRYFMPAIALEWLAIALWIDDLLKNREIAQSVAITLGAIIVIFLLVIVFLKAQAYILTHDEIVQRVSQFTLTETMGKCSPTYIVDRSRLDALTEQSAQLELFHPDPYPGEIASANCLLIGT